MSVIMLSNSINCLEDFQHKDIDKDITSKYLSYNNPLFIMSRQDKIKLELKLPIEICN